MNQLTLKEAADRLGMSSAVLRVYVHRKKIPATKRGSMWFVDDKDIKAYKGNHERTA